jgi:hypothetical protein
MLFKFQSACLPSLNDWRNVRPELVEDCQLLGKAEGRTISATQRLLGKDIRDIWVLLRSAHGIETEGRSVLRRLSQTNMLKEVFDALQVSAAIEKA